MRILPDDLERRVFTVDEAADLFGVGRGTLYRAIKNGEIDAVRIGRRLVVPGVAIARRLGGGRPQNGNGPFPAG
jgi:excisionase family DNA binding protein